ncbi:MAG: ferritin-like domain-containing protein [Bacillota bacterium]
MVRDTTLDILNKFLLLEEGQVVFYSTLAAKAPNEELSRGLKRLAAIETNHVEHLKEKIALLSYSDSPFSALKNTAFEAGLEVFGGTVNIAEGIVGLKNLINAGALAESKAIADYRQALTKIQAPELKDMLWEHLIDEELHLLWLKKQAENLGQGDRSFVPF